MKRQTHRLNLLLLVPLLVSVLLALVVFLQRSDLVWATGEGGETPAARIMLPLVQQGASLDDSQNRVTPTATPTATTTDESTPTATATPTATPPTAPPARPGFFALTDWLSYNAATAVDAQGGIHLAFYLSDERHQDDPRGQAAFYVYCPGPVSACANPSNWSSLVQFDSQVNEVQIVVTADGKPRLLVRRNGSRAHEYNYYACDNECTNAQNWSGLYVREAAGVDLFSAYAPQHSFALDSQGRPRFVYSSGWGIGRPTAIYYAWCDAADCTAPDSWQDTPIYGPIEFKTVTSDYASLVFDGDKPRVVTRLNLSGLPVSVNYHACDAQCGDPANWGLHELSYPDDQMWVNWDLELDAAGHPRVALYEPANIDIHVTGRLFYGWCDAADCTADGSWQLIAVASGEGKNVDLAIDGQGRTHLVYDAGQRGILAEVWCDSNCTVAESWGRRILETSEALQQEFAPASPFSCDQEVRAWLDAVPSVRFGPQGEIVVAYDAVNYTTCYYTDPTRPGDPRSRGLSGSGGRCAGRYSPSRKAPP